MPAGRAGSVRLLHQLFLARAGAGPFEQLFRMDQKMRERDTRLAQDLFGVSVKSGEEMKIQNKTPILFFAFFLPFALFVSFVVPSSSAQKAGGMLYVGTWPRQVLVIDEVAGKVVDQIQLNTGTPQSLTLSY